MNLCRIAALATLFVVGSANSQVVIYPGGNLLPISNATAATYDAPFTYRSSGTVLNVNPLISGNLASHDDTSFYMSESFTGFIGPQLTFASGITETAAFALTSSSGADIPFTISMQFNGHIDSFLPLISSANVLLELLDQNYVSLGTNNFGETHAGLSLGCVSNVSPICLQTNAGTYHAVPQDADYTLTLSGVTASGASHALTLAGYIILESGAGGFNAAGTVTLDPTLSISVPEGTIISGTAFPTVVTAAVPEPATYALFLAGLGVMALVVRRSIRLV